MLIPPKVQRHKTGWSPVDTKEGKQSRSPVSGAWVSLCKAERQQMLCGKVAGRSEVIKRWSWRAVSAVKCNTQTS